jgi:uncharacterized lipoprotein YddW (UPF0748 family)
MTTANRIRLILRALPALLVLVGPTAAAAAAATKTPGKIGVYCNLREESTSPKQLRKTMQDMKAAGIDFILPYTKGTSGDVNWDSKVAPPELVKNREHIGQIVREAHRAGLKVYPVFCVATEGGDTRTNAVLEKNPSWAFVLNGVRVGYIDPGNAAARKYELDLITELVSKYDVDGLSLDYMRCPNRVGYTESGRIEFLKRHAVDLAEVTSATRVALGTEGGRAAATTTTTAAVAIRQHPIWPEWREWRRKQLNEFMGEIRTAVDKARPGLPISSYCWGAHTYAGNFETCQDWKTWIEKGWLDWINPSGYRYTDEAFREAAKLNRENVPKGFPYYITIGVKTSHGTLPDVETLRRQMEMSKQAGADGVIFFTWESLRKFLPAAAGDIKRW